MFGGRTAKVLSDVECSGLEEAFGYCNHRDVQSDSCEYHGDAGVICATGTTVHDCKYGIVTLTNLSLDCTFVFSTPGTELMSRMCKHVGYSPKDAGD